MLEIKFEKQPEKFLSKCEDKLYRWIKNRLNSLKTNPIPQDSKRVLGYEEPTFRIRVGKYRILYRVNYSENRIVVVVIDKRERVYD